MGAKSLTIPALLAASVAGPYVASSAPEWSQQWTGRLAGESQQTTSANRGSARFAIPAASPQNASTPFGLAAPPGTWGASSPPPQTLTAARPTPPPLEGQPPQSLADVLRFDVTKEWVYERWPRKSTALSELDLFGVRVPLVTGTRLTDLAGSLTYFFDQSGRVQRLSFHGRTADTTELVQTAAQRFGLQRQPTIVAGEQLFESRRGQDLISILRTRPAPVLWTTALHDSFSVDLELQDPTTGRPLKVDQAPIPPAKPIPPEPAKGAGKKGASKSSAAKGESDSIGWDAWFPRSRASKAQIRQLDAVDLAQ